MKETTVGTCSSIIGNDVLCHTGQISLKHPEETFAITPASLITLEAIDNNIHLLNGNGIDWGCGSGCLAIAAAKHSNVRSVVGLDIMEKNIKISIKNAAANGVSHKTQFIRSDSFIPCDPAHKGFVERLKGNVNFILANPPFSSHDDGFTFRRRILREANEFLVKDGLFFLIISVQYGRRRIDELTETLPGIAHQGVLSTTDWVEFDLKRNDLFEYLKQYVEEEMRGGLTYEFADPQGTGNIIDARTSLTIFVEEGLSPLSKWQTHLFLKKEE